MIHDFFYKQHFYKQHHAEVGEKPSKCYGWTFLFENHSLLSSSTLSFKSKRISSKKCAKNNCVCFNDCNEIVWLLMKVKIEMKL